MTKKQTATKEKRMTALQTVFGATKYAKLPEIYQKHGGKSRNFPYHMETAFRPILRKIQSNKADLSNPDQKQNITSALMECAEKGYVPGTEAALIPFYNWRSKIFDIVVIATVDGHINKLDTLGIKVNRPVIVYEKDKFTPPFTRFEDGREVKGYYHEPAVGDRGDIIMAIVSYTVREKDESDFVYIDKNYIDNVRDFVKKKNTDKNGKETLTPWDTWTEAMVAKTVIKRIMKILPSQIDMPQIHDLSGDEERYEDDPVAVVPEGGDNTGDNVIDANFTVEGAEDEDAVKKEATPAPAEVAEKRETPKKVTKKKATKKKTAKEMAEEKAEKLREELAELEKEAKEADNAEQDGDDGDNAGDGQGDDDDNDPI